MRMLSATCCQPQQYRNAIADFVFQVPHSTAATVASADTSPANITAIVLHETGLFKNRRIKFLPVTVPGESGVLALISHVEILEFLVTTFREQRRLFDDPISELNVGIFDNVVTVQQHARLSEVRACADTVSKYINYTV
eukprot:21407-Heterococcus_DN1.PRE.3